MGPGQFQRLGNITQGFGAPTPGMKEPSHMGVDIANAKGTPIPSFAQGVVKMVQNQGKPGDNNFGKSVIVQDGDGNSHRYSHLHRAWVKVGDKVSKGQQIGEMGNTGASFSPSGKGDGSHLDYRIWNAYGKYKNPLTYLQGYNRT